MKIKQMVLNAVAAFRSRWFTHSTCAHWLVSAAAAAAAVALSICAHRWVSLARRLVCLSQCLYVCSACCSRCVLLFLACSLYSHFLQSRAQLLFLFLFSSHTFSRQTHTKQVINFTNKLNLCLLCARNKKGPFASQFMYEFINLDKLYRFINNPSTTVSHIAYRMVADHANGQRAFGNAHLFFINQVKSIRYCIHKFLKFFETQKICNCSGNLIWI